MKIAFTLLLLISLCSCGSVEIYGGIRRSDTRIITETTTAPKTSWTDAVTDWLFVDHDKGSKHA